MFFRAKYCQMRPKNSKNNLETLSKNLFLTTPIFIGRNTRIMMVFHMQFRDQLRDNILVKQFYLNVNIAHLISFNEELADKLTSNPADMLPLFEMAVKDSAKQIVYPGSDSKKEFPDCQVTLYSDANYTLIRDLNVFFCCIYLIFIHHLGKLYIKISSNTRNCYWCINFIIKGYKASYYV